MVMQRDVSFPVWTKSKAAVSFLEKTYEAEEIGGKWLVTLDPVNAGGPFTMEIVSDSDSITIKDIYAGDIWLCGGQSNMEMQMQRLRDDYGEEWDELGIMEQGKGGSNQITGKNPLIPNPFSHLIREFRVPQKYDFTSPCKEISGGRWQIASVETLHEFSGTAWFFAKNLYEKYRIPIGLINTAWGGTPVESWMSIEALKDFPEKIANGKQYTDPAVRDEISKKSFKAILEWESRLKKEDAGLKEGWQKPDTNISAWNDLFLPGDFASAGLSAFCGVIWLAKDFDIKADFPSQNAKVWLGTIVDADTVFINGVEIGNTTYRYPPRKYLPENLLKHGKNRIVIRVTCNNGEGGVTCGKPFRIFTDNETAQLSGTWKYRIAAEASVRPQEFFFQRQPLGNYNAMVAPVLKFPLKGVIWYQGESNDSYPYDYDKLFVSMINDWRNKYSEQQLISRNNTGVSGILPFFFVQLPVWKEASDNEEDSSWAIIRDAQTKALSLPVTGMAAALDLGEWNDLHPINKKDVGYRLFLACEKVLAGAENTSPGPVIREVRYENTAENNRRMYITFDNCGGGLCVLSESCAISITTNAFLRTSEINLPSGEEEDNRAYVSVICTEGQARLPAEIAGTDVLCIDLSSVINPQKILYAWAYNPRDRQLFNSEGLPVIPFKIEINKGENNV